MKRSQSYSSILHLIENEGIEHLVDLTKEEKEEIERRKQITKCKQEVEQLRKTIEEIKVYKNQWILAKYSRKIVISLHLISAIYIIAEKSLRVVNTSIYHTVSHQLTIGKLMSNWMKSKFEKSNALQNITQHVKNYHENVFKEYQEQRQRKYKHFFTRNNEESFLQYISSFFSNNSNVKYSLFDNVNSTAAMLSSLFAINYYPMNSNTTSSLKTTKLFGSTKFRTLIKLFGAETLQSALYLILVYWFSKQNVHKRVFALVCLCLLDIYLLIFKINKLKRLNRFQSILMWNLVLNIISLIAYLLAKQHVNTLTGYLEQQWLKD
ncbi:hypothetical protein ABK040_008822 [Willaertia magna]